MTESELADKILELLTSYLYLDLEMAWTLQKLEDLGCSPFDPELADVIKGLRKSIGEAEIQRLEYEIDNRKKKAEQN